MELTRLERGDFDLVAVGRGLLHDPQWLVKIRDRRDDEPSPYEAATAEARLY